MANQRNQGNTSNRGFASMDKEKQREISAEGGRASHGGGRNSGSGKSQRGGASEQNSKGASQSDKNR